jgi:hypothetical protein
VIGNQQVVGSNPTGFLYSGVYHRPNGVFDFFTRLFGDFEDWHSEPSEFFEVGDRVIRLGF